MSSPRLCNQESRASRRPRNGTTTPLWDERAGNPGDPSAGRAATAALVLQAAGSTAHATDVAVGASFDGDGLKEFHLAVREHFHYYKKRRSEWAAIRLDDADLVTLVNVKFLSAHCGISADAIVERHQTDASFIKLSGRWSFEMSRGAPKPATAASAAGAAGGKPRAAGKPEGGRGAAAEKGPAKGGGKGKGKGN